MKTQELTKIALLVAMNAVSAYIIIPLPFSMSPIGLQTLFVNLTALILPARQAALAMTVYLFLGLAGVPVFTAGTAGFGKLFGPTGGYIWAFLPAVFLMSYFKGEKYNFKRYVFVLLFIGMPLIYFCGVMQLVFLTGLNILEAAAIGAAPFLIGDIIKIFAAAYLAGKIKI